VTLENLPLALRRLAEVEVDAFMVAALAEIAADEIERLRAEVARLAEERASLSAQVDLLRAYLP